MAKNRVPTGSTRSLSFDSKIQTSQIEISKSPPSKNLAHVPCKFFRQGICQAGSSCPFAHTLDTLVETAPCKYFQKGNCKFGVKCALAHILPDGRRVNPKSLAQVYQHGSNNNNNNNNNNNTNNNNNNHHLNHHGGSNNNSHRKSFTMDSPQNSNNNNNNNNNNGYLSQSNSYQSASPQNIISSHTLSPQQTVNGFAKYDYLNQSTSPTYQFNSSNNNITSSSRSSFSGSNTSFLYGTTTTTATTNPRTVSMSDQRPTSTYNTPSIWSNTATTSSAVTDSAGSSKPSFFSSSRSVSHSASFRPIFANSSSLTSRDHDHESAILDDEDAHEGMFEEDFVPSSLSDLLTPQELERRGSRPSGTRPLVLPHLKGDEEQQQLPPPPVSDVDEEADDNEMQFRMDEDFQTSSVEFENRGGGGNAYVWHK